MPKKLKKFEIWQKGLHKRDSFIRLLGHTRDVQEVLNRVMKCLDDKDTKEIHIHVLDG